MPGPGLSSALQSAFDKSVAKVRSKGIDSRPKNTQQQINEQINQINQIQQSDADAKSKYLNQQAGLQNLNNLYKTKQEEDLRESIKSSFGKGVFDRSELTGNKGDKTFFGINFGSTPTTAATTINPFTGEKITTAKAREGLTSSEYSDFIGDLFDLNPELGYEEFIPGPMKLIDKGMQLAAPFPLKVLATAAGGGKDLFDFFSDKGSRVGQDLSDQLKTYQEGIKSLNPFKEKTVTADPNAYKGELDYFTANRPFPQKNMTFMPLIGQTPEDALNRKVFGPAPMNQGGLASLNNADYSMLMNASNFGF